MRIPSWRNISVEKYQYINEINANNPDDLDKLLYLITFLTGKSEQQINNISVKVFNRLAIKVKDRFENIKGTYVNYLRGFRFNYNFKRVTLGQYIEVQHFAKMGQIESLHLIAASMSVKGKLSHTQRADKILTLPMLPILYSVGHFLDEFKSFNNNYKGLFGVGEEEGEGEAIEFNERYGWIYSAKKVAEFEGITLEKAFELPVIQAFNDLAYLKAFSQYEEELNKRQRDAIN